MARQYGKEYLENAFRLFGGRMSQKITAFVLGGGAMCFRGQKTGTKDLDIVLADATKARLFTECAKKSGYSCLESLEDAYRLMKAYGILENADGFRLDVFSKKVCGALSLTDGIAGRSESYGAYGNLEVRLVSNEDVVIFKGITERPRDVDDIAAILKSARINWQVILEECSSQEKNGHFYGLLYNKFQEIKEGYGIEAPIMQELLKRDREKLLRNAYNERRKEGMGDKEAVKSLRKEGFSRKEIEKGVGKKLIKP